MVTAARRYLIQDHLVVRVSAGEVIDGGQAATLVQGSLRLVMGSNGVGPILTAQHSQRQERSAGGAVRLT